MKPKIYRRTWKWIEFVEISSSDHPLSYLTFIETPFRNFDEIILDDYVLNENSTGTKTRFCVLSRTTASSYLIDDRHRTLPTNMTLSTELEEKPFVVINVILLKCEKHQKHCSYQKLKITPHVIESFSGILKLLGPRTGSFKEEK